MNKKKEPTTAFELDLDNMPPLSAEEQAGLNALAQDNGALDFSDIPPVQNLERFYRPVKQMTTIRLDADVLAWLRSQGKGYQTKINTLLRREMLASTQANRIGWHEK